MTLTEAVFAASWLVLLTVVVLTFAGVLYRGRRSRLWQGIGLLVLNSSVLVDLFAQQHGWSAGSRGALHSLTWPLMVIGGVLFLIGLVDQARAR